MFYKKTHFVYHQDIKHNSNGTRKFANSVDYGSKIKGFSVRSESIFAGQICMRTSSLIHIKMS